MNQQHESLNGVELSLIAAIGNNWVIGKDGDLPFRLKTDLKRFKRLTTGSPVIMGRKTHDSIGRALPGRPNLVLSRQELIKLPDGVEAFRSFEAALDSLAGLHSQCFVIGGASVYAEALPLANRLDLTWVDCDVDGDTYFPRFDLSAWHVVEEEPVAANADDEFSSVYKRYTRKAVVPPDPTDEC